MKKSFPAPKKIGFLVWLCALLFAGSAEAFSVQFAWTPPTQNVDGSTLASTDLIGYRLYGLSSLTAAPPYTLDAAVAGGSTSTATVTIPDPATGTCVTYYFAITAVSKTLESPLSNIVPLPVCQPKAPTGVSAQYQIIFLGK